jgi:hypothetical protein
LYDYGEELRSTNLGRTFYLCLNTSQIFTSCYWAVGGCKKGFLEGYRPVICVDGCHLKTRYGGVLLTDVNIDPNDCIFPIAMAVVKVECTDSWLWFLNTLKTDLGIGNSIQYTIMSDRQKVFHCIFRFVAHMTIIRALFSCVYCSHVIYLAGINKCCEKCIPRS